MFVYTYIGIHMYMMYFESCICIFVHAYMNYIYGHILYLGIYIYMSPFADDLFHRLA